MAAHALFDAAVLKRLLGPAIAALTVTDTAGPIMPVVPAQTTRLGILSVAPMIGQCLVRMHSGRPISPVLDPTGLGH
jgi:phosphoribosylpyrophosphate synthetase